MKKLKFQSGLISHGILRFMYSSIEYKALSIVYFFKFDIKHFFP